MSKYTIADMEDKYGQYYDSSPRGRVYIMAALASLHKSLDASAEALAFERKVNSRVNEIFKGWFHREG